MNKPTDSPPIQRGRDHRGRDDVTSGQAASHLQDQRILRFDPPENPLISLTRRAFRESGRVQLIQLKLSCAGNCLRLEGTLPSYHLRQIAAQMALCIPGIDQVEDWMTVSQQNQIDLRHPNMQ